MLDGQSKGKLEPLTFASCCVSPNSFYYILYIYIYIILYIITSLLYKPAKKINLSL
jgi:hypothetical protein